MIYAPQAPPTAAKTGASPGSGSADFAEQCQRLGSALRRLEYSATRRLSPGELATRVRSLLPSWNDLTGYEADVSACALESRRPATQRRCHVHSFKLNLTAGERSGCFQRRGRHGGDATAAARVAGGLNHRARLHASAWQPAAGQQPRRRQRWEPKQGARSAGLAVTNDSASGPLPARLRWPVPDPGPPGSPPDRRLCFCARR